MARSDSPFPPDGDGRPLDERESREFDRIVRGLQQNGGRAKRSRAERGACSQRNRLTWRQVLLVLSASAAYAVSSALLPYPANLWSPVAVLCAAAVISIVYGVQREHRP